MAKVAERGQQPQSNDDIIMEVVNGKPSVFHRMREKRALRIQKRTIESERVERAQHKAERNFVLFQPSEEKNTSATTEQKPSTTSQIRSYLQAGNSLTVRECRERFHTTELRYYIAKLRKHMTIQDEWIHNEATGARYKRYFCN